MLTAAVSKERRRYTRSSIPISSYTSKLNTTPVKQVLTSTPTTTPSSLPPPSTKPTLLDSENPDSETQHEELDTFDKTLEDIQPPPVDRCHVNETEQPSGVIVHSLEGFGLEVERKYEERFREILPEMEDEVVRNVAVDGAEAKKNLSALDPFVGIFSPFRTKKPPRDGPVKDAHERSRFKTVFENGRIDDEKFVSVLLEEPACVRKNSPSRSQPLAQERVPAFISPSKQLMDCLPPKTDISRIEKMPTPKHHRAPKVTELRSMFEKGNPLPNTLPVIDHSSTPPTGDNVKKNSLQGGLLETAATGMHHSRLPYPEAMEPRTSNTHQVGLQETAATGIKHSLLPYPQAIKEQINNTHQGGLQETAATGIENSLPSYPQAMEPRTNNTHQGEIAATGIAPQLLPYPQVTEERRPGVPTLEELRSMTKGIEILAQEGCDAKTRAAILQGLKFMFHDGPKTRPWEIPVSNPIRKERENTTKQSTTLQSTPSSERKLDMEPYLHKNDHDEDEDDEVGDQVMLEAVHVEEMSIADIEHGDVGVTDGRTSKLERHKDAAEHSWNEADGAMLRDIMSNDGSAAGEYESEDDRDALEVMGCALDNMEQFLINVGKSMDNRKAAKRLAAKTLPTSDTSDNKTMKSSADDKKDTVSRLTAVHRVGVRFETTPPNCAHVGINTDVPITRDIGIGSDVEISSHKNAVPILHIDRTTSTLDDEILPDGSNLDAELRKRTESRQVGGGSDFNVTDTGKPCSEQGRIPSTCHRSTTIDRDDLRPSDTETNGFTSFLRQRSVLVAVILLLSMFLLLSLPSGVCSTYTVLDACFTTKTIHRREVMGVPVEVEKFTRWGSRPDLCGETGDRLAGPAGFLANYLMENWLSCPARDWDGMEPS